MFISGVIFACVTPIISQALTLTYNGSMDISGVVAGPPPTTPATITSPTNGQVVHDTPIAISGTCGPNLVVKIWRNDVFAGSTICNNSGSFQLLVSLLEGQNILRARNYDFADQPGPDSSDVTVIYQKNTGNGGYSNSQIGSRPTSRDAQQQLATMQFIMTTSTGVKGVRLTDNLEWEFELINGSPPYALLIKWGDGQQDLKSISSSGKITLQHAYQQAGTFTVELKATDKDSHETFLQVMAIVYDKSGLAGGASPTRPKFPSGRSPLYLIWQIYAVVAIILFAFWLGEKHELAWLNRRNLIKKY